MAAQFPENSCGICGGTTLCEDGKRRVWYYEPRSDYYCARHWEQALTEDSRQYLENAHWRQMTLPLLQLTQRKLEHQAGLLSR